MKIKIKTLKGGVFPLDTIEPTTTIKELKERIFAEKGFEVKLIKLIHAGKVLDDSTSVADAKIKDGGFVVCMVSKAKKKPAAAPAAAPAPAPAPAAAPEPAPAAAPAPATAPAATPAPAPAAATPTDEAAATPASTAAPTTPAAPAPAAPDAAPPAPAPAAPAAGLSAEDAAKVAQLQEMGFPEAECQRALAAAFGNADRAVEYLMTGIPDNVAAMQPPAAAPTAPATSGGAPPATGDAPAATPAAGGGPFAALRAHPQFDQLRRVIQANPAMLGTVLQQLAAQDPALMEAINADRQGFIDLMNEPVAAAPPAPAPGGNMFGGAPPSPGGGGMPTPQDIQQLIAAMQSMPPEQRAQMSAAMGIPQEQLEQFSAAMQQNPALMQQMLAGMMGGGGPGGGGGPPQNVIRLTQEEAAAVDRLSELGFPKRACVEAYFACDKNEELAANYLFTNPPDAMDES